LYGCRAGQPRGAFSVYSVVLCSSAGGLAARNVSIADTASSNARRMARISTLIFLSVVPDFSFVVNA